MSIRKRGPRRWEVQWRENGVQRSRTFVLKADANAFETDIKRRKALGRGILAEYASKPKRLTVDPVMLEQTRPGPVRGRPSLADEPFVVRTGITYAISSEPYDGWVKIGRSANQPDARIDALQTGNPRPLVFRAVWPIDVERELHQAYEEFRGYGEWFALPLEMLRDMARFANESEPHRLLLHMWPVRRVLAAA